MTTNKMDRRDFIAKSIYAAGAVAAGSAAVLGSPQSTLGAETKPGQSTSPQALGARAIGPRTIDRCRFGINYTPSHNWWYCWNDWQTNPIERDLDAIAGLGADHLRILLIWPFFQPNASWVSTAHLDRLSQLLSLIESRNLDAVVTVFTGQLSGLFFLPPFHPATSGFYTDPAMWKAQTLFVRALAQTIRAHPNVIGFDLGNELDTCWKADTADGDAWMTKMLALMDEAAPGKTHVNGVDSDPWFRRDTFSARALAARPFPVIHCYPWWTHALRYGGPMDPPSVKLVAAMATLARSYSGNPHRPIWVEEFNTCFAFFSQAQQAEWLHQAVTSALDAGVSWFTYWGSHDLDPKFTFNKVEYHLGLLTNDNKVKQQGAMFRELAQAYRGKPVTFPTQAPPPPPTEITDENTWQWLLNWMGWKAKA